MFPRTEKHAAKCEVSRKGAFVNSPERDSIVLCHHNPFVQRCSGSSSSKKTVKFKPFCICLTLGSRQLRTWPGKKRHSFEISRKRTRFPPQFCSSVIQEETGHVLDVLADPQQRNRSPGWYTGTLVQDGPTVTVVTGVTKVNNEQSAK